MSKNDLVVEIINFCMKYKLFSTPAKIDEAYSEFEKQLEKRA